MEKYANHLARNTPDVESELYPFWVREVRVHLKRIDQQETKIQKETHWVR